MRTSVMAGLVMSISVAFAVAGWAQQAPVERTVNSNEPGKVNIGSMVRASAIVTAVDPTSRTVTLRAASGQSFDVVAGDEVKNFAQIKIGDEVVVEYLQAVSVELMKVGGTAPGASDSAAATRAKPGEKPAGAIARQVTAVADVIDVNPAMQTMTFRGPKGNVVEVAVANPAHFDVVKKGDQVEVVYTEAVALTVQPATNAAK